MKNPFFLFFILYSYALARSISHWLIAVFLFSCSSPEGNPILPSVPLDSTDSFQKFSTINEKLIAEPNNASLYFQRAKLYFDNKDLESSFNDINRALNLDSSNADFYLLLADIHFIKKEGIKAKEVLNKCIEIDPKKTEAYLKLSEVYFLVEQYGKSIEYINQAIKIDAHNANAYFMKGMNYKYMGDTAKAISSMQTAAEQNNDFYDAYIQLGLMFSEKHDSLAVHYYENALRIEPKSTEALYGKAMFLQEHGHPERALNDYRKIMEIDKNNYIAYFNTGFVYLVYLKKFQEATDNFTTAIELNPKYYEAYCNRGIAYEKMSASPLTPLHLRGEFLKMAEVDFRKALELKPDFAPAAKGISRVVDKDFE